MQAHGLAPRGNRIVNLNLPLIGKIHSYVGRLDFLASSLAIVLNVSKVFNDDFINVQYDASLFCAPLVEDFADSSRLSSYMSIFTEEVHSQLFNIVINWAPSKSHGLHSCFLAACSCDYWYGRGRAANNPLPNFMRILCMIISEIFYHSGKLYNAVHVNIFLRKSRLQAHADDERSLGSQPNILSLSIGSTRIFRVTHPDGSITDVPLSNGAIAQMSGNFQVAYRHEINKGGSYEGPRINFTFRDIVEHNCDSYLSLVRDISSDDIPDLLPHQIRWFAS